MFIYRGWFREETFFIYKVHEEYLVYVLDINEPGDFCVTSLDWIQLFYMKNENISDFEKNLLEKALKPYFAADCL